MVLKSADLKKKSPKAKMQLKTKIEFVSEYIILSNGPLICKKKIQFTTNNTFYFFVISHMHPCVH